MDKVRVELCMGTTCYVMGAAHLVEFAQNLPAEFEGRVDVTGVRCLGLCGNENFSGAPFARVNGIIVDAATIERITDAVRKALG